MFQTKEKDKTSEELSDRELCKLPDKEFRVMTVEMFKELWIRMDAQSRKLEDFIKELDNTKDNQTKLKKITTDMKNTPEGINIRLNEMEEWINELEDRILEVTATKQEKKRKKKRNQDHLRDLWGNIKNAIICIIGVSEGEKRRNGHDKMFE